MNILKDSVCYLAGPIDFAKDQGKGHRQQIQELTKEIGIKYLDPTNKLASLCKEVDEEQQKIIEYKKNGQYVELREMMKNIIRSDLRCIDYSDFVICYIDTSIHMCGTYHEIFLSISQHKPTFIVVEGGLAKSPSWLFGISKLEFLFNSIEELCDHLHKIDSGEIPLSKEWVLIRKYI